MKVRNVLLAATLLMLAFTGPGQAQVSGPPGRAGLHNGYLSAKGVWWADDLTNWMHLPAERGVVGQAILLGADGMNYYGDVVAGDTLFAVDSTGGVDTVIVAKIVTDLAPGEWSGQWYERVAGEKLFYGDAVFARAADNKVYGAKATSGDSMPAIGIVVSPDSVLADSTVQLLFSGAICDTSLSLTPTNLIYVDTATAGNVIAVPGAFGNVPGYVAVAIGSALDDSTYLLEIDFNVAVAGDSLYKRAIVGAGMFAEDSLWLNGVDILFHIDSLARIAAGDSAQARDAAIGNLETAADSSLRQLSINLADSTVDGQTVIDTAGENLAFGRPVYRSSDGKLYYANGDTTDASTYELPVVYLVAAKAGITADAAGLFLRDGLIRADGWSWTKGLVVQVDTVEGQLWQGAPTVTGHFGQILGHAVNASVIDFKNSMVPVEKGP